MPSFLQVETPQRLWAYVQIARIDHWFKNVFMLLGVLVAFFYEPTLFAWAAVPSIALALLSTCLIASSNYVINELLDAPSDRFHPVKKYRPVPSGRVHPSLAVLEWLLLGAVGIGLAFFVNLHFAATGFGLWLMGAAYNIPPLRTKEMPYLDVLSESINNPLRLLLGWFPLISDRFPPVSLLISYWMVGAFFMATKRFAEYRCLGDAETAAQYRRSFRYYNDERLLVSMLFYATLCALFFGIFIVRYHIELILFMPISAGFFAYYLKLGLQQNSPVQHPEKLFRETGFLTYTVLSTICFILLMFAHIPFLYRVFNVEPSKLDILWTFGQLH